MIAFLTVANSDTVVAAMALVESILAQEEDEIDIFVACSDVAAYEAVAGVRIPHVRPRHGSGDLVADARALMAEAHGYDVLVALSPRCFLFAPMGQTATALALQHGAAGCDDAFVCRWRYDPADQRAAATVAITVPHVRRALPRCVHFENVRMVSADLVVVDVDETARISTDALVCCVVPYVDALQRSVAWARSVTMNVNLGMSPNALGAGHTFLAAESLRPFLDQRALPHARARLDAVWTCYMTEQMISVPEKMAPTSSVRPPVPFAVFSGDEHQLPSPRVSALVSTYGAEDLIAGCLEDLVAQTLFQKGELEILVVDSASPGNEKAIVERFMSAHPGRIRYLRTRRREGVYMAWNRAARAARGAYLTNANTDDRHRHDALERLADELDASPDIGLVYGRTLVTRDANADYASARIVGKFVWPAFDREQLLHGCFIGPHPMWRKSVHGVVGWFDQRYRVAADFELWLRIVERFGARLVDDYLGLYLFREQSVENANRNHCARESIAARELYALRAGVNITPGRFPATYLEGTRPEVSQPVFLASS